MVEPPKQGGFFVKNGQRHRFYGGLGGINETVPAKERQSVYAQLLNQTNDNCENFQLSNNEQELEDQWKILDINGEKKQVNQIWLDHPQFWTCAELQDALQALDEAEVRKNDSNDKPSLELRKIAQEIDTISSDIGVCENSNRKSKVTFNLQDNESMIDNERTRDIDMQRIVQHECMACGLHHTEDENNWIKCGMCWKWVTMDCLKIQCKDDDLRYLSPHNYWTCFECAEWTIQSRTSIKSMETRLTSLETKYRKIEPQQTLQTENDALQQQVKTWESRAKQLYDHKTKLETSIEDERQQWNKQSETMMQQAKDLEKKNQELIKKIDESRKNIIDLKRTNTQMQSIEVENKQLRDRIADLQKQINQTNWSLRPGTSKQTSTVSKMPTSTTSSKMSTTVKNIATTESAASHKPSPLFRMDDTDSWWEQYQRETQQKSNEATTNLQQNFIPSTSREKERPGRSQIKDPRERKRVRSLSAKPLKKPKIVCTKKVGVLSDSQLKHIIMDNQLEELWMRMNYDNDVYLYRGSTSNDLREQVQRKGILDNCDVVILSVGSNDLSYITDDPEDMEDEKENAALLNYIVHDIVQLTQFFTEKGQLVYWVTPPIRTYRKPEAYHKLISEIRDQNIANLIIVDDATRDKKVLDPKDGTHMTRQATKDLIIKILEHINGMQIQLTENPNIHEAIDKLQIFGNKCWACGSTKHDARACPKKEDIQCKYCLFNGHIAQMCLTPHRMCHWCGRKGGHQRNKCLGWWSNI